MSHVIYLIIIMMKNISFQRSTMHFAWKFSFNLSSFSHAQNSFSSHDVDVIAKQIHWSFSHGVDFNTMLKPISSFGGQSPKFFLDGTEACLKLHILGEAFSFQTLIFQGIVLSLPGMSRAMDPGWRNEEVGVSSHEAKSLFVYTC